MSPVMRCQYQLLHVPLYLLMSQHKHLEFQILYVCPFFVCLQITHQSRSHAHNSCCPNACLPLSTMCEQRRSTCAIGGCPECVPPEPTPRCFNRVHPITVPDAAASRQKAVICTTTCNAAWCMRTLAPQQIQTLACIYCLNLLLRVHGMLA
jgi:hypothetical protein